MKVQTKLNTIDKLERLFAHLETLGTQVLTGITEYDTRPRRPTDPELVDPFIQEYFDEVVANSGI